MFDLHRICPPNSKRRKLARKLLIETQWVPKHISKNFRKIDQSGFDLIRKSIEENYWSPGHDQTEEGREALLEQLYRRLEMDRRLVAPWLNSVKPLKGSNILEIGCGTGSSTVSLAEQGARVTGIDIHDKFLAVARERCRIYGLDVEFYQVNATDAHKVFVNRKFDFIIFYASLEHMTLDERLIAMHATWEMLSPGDLWCIIECPNRLWYYDSHTSLLPFYFWLPDDLAQRYSQFSSRKKCKELMSKSQLEFLRAGRGVSFHEFELAMKPLSQLNVVSRMWLYNAKRNPLIWLKRRFSADYHYGNILSHICPNIDRGFLQPTLDLVIKK